MKTGNRLMSRKAIALLLVLTIVFSMMASMTTVAYAATNKTDENLITNVSNPSNATISFKLNVPAGVTVSYKVELIPNKRTGSIDTISGSVKNTGSSKITKTISAVTRYYSNKYTVTASYSTGPARNRTNYSDTDDAVSALKTTISTNKFVWDDANIKKWQAGQVVSVVLGFAITGTVDLLVTKGYLSSALAAVITGTVLVANLGSATTVTDTKTISYTPIKGWGYQYKLTPYNGGFTKYLLVYDAKGKLYETYNMGSISLGTIYPAVR